MRNQKSDQSNKIQTMRPNIKQTLRNIIRMILKQMNYISWIAFQPNTILSITSRAWIVIYNSASYEKAKGIKSQKNHLTKRQLVRQTPPLPALPKQSNAALSILILIQPIFEARQVTETTLGALEGKALTPKDLRMLQSDNELNKVPC